MISASSRRVPEHTSEEINRRIRRDIERNVARAAAGGPYTIDDRLAELDREWDVERLLQANFAGVVLLGSLLGSAVDRRFYTLPAVAALFMVQHVVQGWCPPLPLFRRMKFRTSDEIGMERAALKALRGDFMTLPAGPGQAHYAVEAAAQ